MASCRDLQAVADRAAVRDLLVNRAFRPGEGWRREGTPLGWSLDCREIALAADALPAISRLVYDLLAPFRPRAIAGTGLSGAPLVTAVVLESARRGDPLDGILLRGQPKPYGRRRQLEGPLPPPGSPVAIVDDLESSGATANWAIEALLAHGLRPVVVATLVKFDQESGHQERHDEVPRRSLFLLSELGIGECREPAGTPRLLWQVDDGNHDDDDVPHSRPTRSGDLVVYGTNRGFLHALDVSGRRRWRTPLGDPPSPTHCTPLFVAQHGVVIGSDDGLLRCVDRETGLLRWVTRCGDRIGAGLTSDDGTGHILVPATDLPRSGLVLSIRAGDGTVVSRQPLSGYAHSRPVCTDSVVLAADNSGTVTALTSLTSLTSLEPVWRRALGAPIKADLTVDDTGTCYCADFDGVLTALDIADGGIRWRRRLGRCVYTTPLIADGLLHVAADHHLYALERHSGRVVWVVAVGQRPRGAISRLADGTIATGCGDGAVRFVSSTGRLLGLFRAGGAVMSGATVLSSDAVLASSADGHLYAVQPPTPA